jgi:hypothetical protein
MEPTRKKNRLNRIMAILVLSILFGVMASFVLALADFHRSNVIFKMTHMPSSTPTITLTPTQTTTPTVSPRSTNTRAPVVTGTSAPSPTLAPQSTRGSVDCCIHCGPVYKPCGDGCIAKDKTCRKPPGCACR